MKLPASVRIAAQRSLKKRQLTSVRIAVQSFLKQQLTSVLTAGRSRRREQRMRSPHNRLTENPLMGAPKDHHVGPKALPVGLADRLVGAEVLPAKAEKRALADNPLAGNSNHF
jgi:hypothetical protein